MVRKHSQGTQCHFHFEFKYMHTDTQESFFFSPSPELILMLSSYSSLIHTILCKEGEKPERILGLERNLEVL